MEAVVEGDLAGLCVVLVDKRSRVVDQYLAGGAAEVTEGAFQALQPGRLALVQEQSHVGPARVAQRGHEEVYLDRLVGDRHTHGAEVDLQLMPRRGLEANRGRRLGEHFAAQVRHGSLDGAQAHSDAVLALQFLAHDITVAAVLAEPLGQPFAVGPQPARPLRLLVRLPATLTQIAAHGVAAAAQFPADALGSPAQRRQLEHRLYVLRRLHRLPPFDPLGPGSLLDHFFHFDLLPRRGSIPRVVWSEPLRLDHGGRQN